MHLSLIHISKGCYLQTFSGVLVAAAVSFLLSSLILKVDKSAEADFQDSIVMMAGFKGNESRYFADVTAEKAETKTVAPVHKILFACDAGMGSSAMGAAGLLYTSNGPIRTLSPEKQAELGKEMMVAKLDEIPTADSVAIVVYGMCTRMADGVTGECIVADSGMMRNIMAFQPAIEEYPPKEG